MRKRSNQHRHLRPKGFFAHLKHYFRERQIYVRSKGEVQFVTIRSYMMVIGLFVLVSGFFWIAFASINVTFKDELLAVKERDIYQNRLDNEERISDLRKTIDGLNEKLMLDQGGYLQEVDKLRGEYYKLVGQQKRLTAFFRQGWLPMRNKPAPRSGEAEKTTSPNPTDRQRGKQDFFPARARDGAKNHSGKRSFNQLSLGQKYAANFTSRQQALQPLEDVRTQMREFAGMQEQLLDEVIAFAQKQGGKTNRIFTKLGVNPDNVVKRASLTSTDAVGGPFVSATRDGVLPSGVAVRMEKAVAALNRSKLLRQQARKLPLVIPVDKITRITSRFGLRRDPFRKVAAMHTGLDIKAPYGAPVRSTADGVVISAGWAGGYGRRVAVQHKNGIVTKYAHMSKILVKKGQRVKRGDRVGLIGSSGRSTGPHVHYETRLNGRLMNPARFWKARNDLQTLSQ